MTVDDLPNELDVLRDVSRRFNHAGIAFMLTGSMAMGYYATPRMTRDIDLVVELRASDTDRVVALFAPQLDWPGTRSRLRDRLDLASRPRRAMGECSRMIDTSPDVDAMYRAMLLARTGAERVLMGARMFDAARAMVLASLPAGLSESETRRQLFARLYPEVPREQVPPELRSG